MKWGYKSTAKIPIGIYTFRSNVTSYWWIYKCSKYYYRCYYKCSRYYYKCYYRCYYKCYYMSLISTDLIERRAPFGLAVVPEVKTIWNVFWPAIQNLLLTTASRSGERTFILKCSIISGAPFIDNLSIICLISERFIILTDLFSDDRISWSMIPNCVSFFVISSM